jgi:hypothetical protein
LPLKEVLIICLKYLFTVSWVFKILNREENQELLKVA